MSFLILLTSRRGRERAGFFNSIIYSCFYVCVFVQQCFMSLLRVAIGLSEISDYDWA